MSEIHITIRVSNPVEQAQLVSEDRKHRADRYDELGSQAIERSARDAFYAEADRIRGGSR